MADKHPRDMTAGELERLPVVNVIAAPAADFIADGQRWLVGRSGTPRP